MWDVSDDEPSVVIITINVQHLLALDAEDTAMRLEADLKYGEKHICTQKAHIQSILLSNKISIGVSSLLAGGMGGGVVPVPRTTTSYSGATSSMIVVCWRVY